jgi:hypothetical protein
MSGYRVGTGGVEMTDAAGVALRDQNKTYCYDFGLKDPIRMAPIHKKCCFPCMLAGYPDHTATRTTADHMPICWLCDQDWYEPGGFSPPPYAPSHPRVPSSYQGDPLDPRPGEPVREYCARFFLHKRRRFQEVVRLAGHRHQVYWLYEVGKGKDDLSIDLVLRCGPFAFPLEFDEDFGHTKYGSAEERRRAIKAICMM